MHASNCSCGGTGYLNCTSCGGSGHKNEQESRSSNRYNPSTGRYDYYTEYYTVSRSCSTCSGSGKKACLGKDLQRSIYETQFGISIKKIEPNYTNIESQSSGIITFFTRLKDEGTITIFIDNIKIGKFENYWLDYNSVPNQLNQNFLTTKFESGTYKYDAFSTKGSYWKGKVTFKSGIYDTIELKKYSKHIIYTRIPKEQILIEVNFEFPKKYPLDGVWDKKEPPSEIDSNQKGVCLINFIPNGKHTIYCASTITSKYWEVEIICEPNIIKSTELIT